MCVPLYQHEQGRRWEEKRGTGKNMKWHSQDSTPDTTDSKTSVNYRYFLFYSSGILGVVYEETASPWDKDDLPPTCQDVSKDNPELQSHFLPSHPKFWYYRPKPPSLIYTVLGFKIEHFLNASQVFLPPKLHSSPLVLFYGWRIWSISAEDLLKAHG